jgi:hypothetical protein
MWTRIWSVLLDEKYLKLFTFILCLVGAVATGLWTVFTFHLDHSKQSQTPSTTTLEEKGNRFGSGNIQTLANINPEIILLNILRAAYREPLQFIDVTVVTQEQLRLKGGLRESALPHEFYQRLQSPISAQVVVNYANAGISLNLLLPLLISDITLEEPDQIGVLHNTGTSALSFLGFRYVTKQLAEHGLGLFVKEKEQTLCVRNKLFRYREEEPDFEQSLKAEAKLDIPGGPIQIPSSMFCDAPLQSKRQKSSITLRSVQQIFFFLGNLVRIELGLNDDAPVDLRNPDYFTHKAVPLYPLYLFRVEERPPMNGEISANFHGATYTVTSDPTGADASSQVLGILIDLIALQSSAKSLPSPSATTTQ